MLPMFAERFHLAPPDVWALSFRELNAFLKHCDGDGQVRADAV